MGRWVAKRLLSLTERGVLTASRPVGGREECLRLAGGGGVGEKLLPLSVEYVGLEIAVGGADIAPASWRPAGSDSSLLRQMGIFLLQSPFFIPGWVKSHQPSTTINHSGEHSRDSSPSISNHSLLYWSEHFAHPAAYSLGVKVIFVSPLPPPLEL